MPQIIPEEENRESNINTFVYQPGGIQIGNVYTSWIELIANLELVNGPKVIQIDDSFISPAVITSGTYDLSNCEMVGVSQDYSNPTTVRFSDGCVIYNLGLIKNLKLSGNSNSAVFPIATDTQMRLENTIVSVLPGKSPLFQVTSDFDLYLDNSKFIDSDVILNTDSDTTTIWLEDKSTISTDLISSGVGGAVNFNIIDPNCLLSSQSLLGGSSITVLLSESSLINYDNGASGLTATTVQEAIDELALGGVGSGVSGPVSSIDYGVAVWDGTSGDTLRDSGVRFYGKSATDPTSPTPANGDYYYNTSLNMMMQYDSTRSKWLSIQTETFTFGRVGPLGPGQYFYGIGGRVLSSTLGLPAFYKGTVISIGFVRSNTDTVTIEVTEDGTTIASQSLSSLTKGVFNSINVDFDQEGIIAARNSDGGNDVYDFQGFIRYKWRI